ncbi:MAG: DNA topoisomerase I, partial [Cytophagales bacterium]|nr:DNA topoisomerase I [Cytophagales bacterium]
NVVDYSFTATVEKDFDEIAHGKLEWEKMIDTFYGAFHKKVENTETNVSRTDIGTSREIGLHPETKEKILVKLGKYGPYVQVGEAEGDIKPKYASLKKGQLMESLTLEDALELFKLPREIGLFEGKPMVAAIGKFGPYVKHDSKFYSIPKGEDPLTLEEIRAVEIIESKRKADSEKLIKEFDLNSEVKVLNGRFGPYIVVGKKNVKIPKGQEPKDLTLDECLALAEATPDKPAGRRSFGKKK